MRRWSWPWFWHKPASSPHPVQRFGYAVVGVGHGAHKFLKALRSSPTTYVAALVSAHPATATRFARRYGVPAVYSYNDLDRIADDPRIHAVYLSLPNALHRPFTERAARAGKHVLCEKPMAATAEDCAAMITACHAAGRLLMIAYRVPFTSVHQRARDLLASGSLGRVLAVRSTFGFHAKPGWRLDPALAGGGSLFDVGVYSIRTLRELCPGPLTLTAAQATRDPQTGLELDLTWQGTLANGATVHCRSSFLEKLSDRFEVHTERATLTLDPAFAYKGLCLTVRAHNPADRAALNLRLSTPRKEPSAFRLEAEHLALQAQTGNPPHTPGETGLEDLQTMEAIYGKL